MKKLFLVIFLGLTLIIAGQSAYAAVEGSLNVTAVVNGTCSSISATAVDLSYTSGGDQQNGSTTISVVCTAGTSVNVSINAGTCGGSDVANRMLCNGDQTMNVNLNEAGTSNNFTSTTIASTTGSGTADTFDVDIVVPAAQEVAPGEYASTFTVSTDL